MTYDQLVSNEARKLLEDALSLPDDERRKLVSTEQSLGMPDEPKIPTAISGLETFTLTDTGEDEDEREGDLPDADSFFNLPDNDDDDEDEDDRR